MDPLWLGLLFSLAGLILGIVGFTGSYRFAWTRKRLLLEVLPPIPLVSVGDEVRSRVTVLFDGEEALDAKAVTIRVRNSGNVPIKKEDYDRPPKLLLGEGVRVLSSAVTETKGAGLRLSAEIEDSNTLALEQALLNGGDAVSLGLVLSGPFSEKKVVPDIRISGNLKRSGETWTTNVS